MFKKHTFSGGTPKTIRRTSRRIATGVAWVCAVLLGTTVAHGQISPAGSIRGIVRDQQGAVLPGAAVTATSADAPTARTTVSDERGAFRLLELSPGLYTLTASLAGFATRELRRIEIRAGLNLELDLTLVVGLAETVYVRREVPLLEASTATQAVNISGELQQRLPLGRSRRWSDSLQLVPGIMTVPSATLLANYFYLHGADSSSNVTQLDGLNVVPTMGTAGSWHLNINPDLVEDIQVKTAGVDASSPLGLGAVINIASRSGTNTFSGTSTLTWQPKRWNDVNAPGTTAELRQTQLDLSGGGPLLTGRAWWFAAYRVQRADAGIPRTPEELEALRALIPGYEAYDRGTAVDMVYAKPTVQLGPKHLLSIQAQHDASAYQSGGPYDETPSEVLYGGPAAGARVASTWTSSWLTRVAISWNGKRTDQAEPDLADRPNQWVYRDVFPSAGRLVGAGPLAILGAPTSLWTESANQRLGITADATYHHPSLFGSHDVQFGVSWEPLVRYVSRVHYVNGGRSREEAVLADPDDVRSAVIPFFRLTTGMANRTSADRAGRDVGLYVQDTWRPIERVTATLGVRLDAIRQEDRYCLEVGLAEPKCVIQSSFEVGPRLGLNYLLTKDGRTRLSASWGRVHESLIKTSASITSSDPGRREEYDTNLDGTFETVFETPAQVDLVGHQRVASDWHQPYVNEWTLSLSRQLSAGFVLTASALQREYRHRGTYIDTNAVYEDGLFTGYRNEDFNEVFTLTNNRWNWPVTTSLELVVTRQTAALQMLASYARQWRHIAGDWQPGDPAAFIQPEAFPNNRGIGSTGLFTFPTLDAIDSLSGRNMTDGANRWQDHAIHLGVSWNAPFGILAGGTYTWQSGYWSGPIVTRIDAPDPHLGPPTVALSNGRVVENPLATTIRFAHPTRGEGQLRTPQYHALSLRAGRSFEIGAVRLDAFVDLLNATNAGEQLFFAGGANQLYSPTYAGLTSRQPPRAAQVTLRVGL